MRLFWKVFAVLWLATLLVGGSGFLVSRTLQQDWLLLQFHPQLRDFAEKLVEHYEQHGPRAAQSWLEQQRREYRLRANLYDANGQLLLPGTLPTSPRFADPRGEPGSETPRYGRLFQLIWDSPDSTYQLTLHVPSPELFRWQRTPLALIANVLLAMTVLALLSLLLSRYLTAPLAKLGQAAQALAKGNFDAAKLQDLGQRQDEFGELSRQFESMGNRVQSLLDSQRQLMRDISHELRSPLARLRIGLALGSKQQLSEDDPLWVRLDRECSRLDALIDDILTLSRLDTQDQPRQPFELDSLVARVLDDAQFAAEDCELVLEGQTQATLQGWPEQLYSALDNLLRNAQRFSPTQGLIRVRLSRLGQNCLIEVDDQGPGVPQDWLSQLGEPFVRLPGQATDSGHGLGLAIARRAVERHQGQLSFAASDLGGLKARITLKLAAQDYYTS